MQNHFIKSPFFSLSGNETCQGTQIYQLTMQTQTHKVKHGKKATEFAVDFMKKTSHVQRHRHMQQQQQQYQKHKGHKVRELCSVLSSKEEEKKERICTLTRKFIASHTYTYT